MTILKKKRLAIFERDGWQCRYCGTPLSIHTSTIDHIDPSPGTGRNRVQNLGASCNSCNASKGDRHLEDYRLSVAISRTDMAGLVNYSSYKRLVSVGVIFPELPAVLFHYERVAMRAST